MRKFSGLEESMGNGCLVSAWLAWLAWRRTEHLAR
jgi:hypothetical protein